MITNKEHTEWLQKYQREFGADKLVELFSNYLTFTGDRFKKYRQERLKMISEHKGVKND